MKSEAYERWLRELDVACDKRCGFTAYDLPDLVDVAQRYEEGATPDQVAEEVIQAAIGGDSW